MADCITCKRNEGTVLYMPSDNFTSHDLLSAGTKMCKQCHEIVTDRNSRTSNWILEDTKITFFKRDKVIETLLRHKVVPFILYCTQTYKTQGFLKLMARPNLTNEVYHIGFDRDVVQVRQSHLTYLVDLIVRARTAGWSKKELTGDPYIKRYEDRVLCDEVHAAQSEPVWELLVWADMTEVKKK